jgi:hypothetical protein
VVAGVVLYIPRVATKYWQFALNFEPTALIICVWLTTSATAAAGTEASGTSGTGVRPPMVWRPARPFRRPPLHPPPPALRAREATTNWHLEVVGAKPPRSSPIRPPPGGLEADWEVCSHSSLAMPHTPNTRETALGGGQNPLKKCPLELHIKFWGRYTSSLGIHCAVSVQGLRQGVNQEVRLKARKVRVMRFQAACNRH